MMLPETRIEAAAANNSLFVELTSKQSARW